MAAATGGGGAAAGARVWGAAPTGRRRGWGRELGLENGERDRVGGEGFRSTTFAFFLFGFSRMAGSLLSVGYLASSGTLLHSSAMKASAILAPLSSHSRAISGLPQMVMTPRGPGIFIMLYA